jgi:hypothetical protein
MEASERVAPVGGDRASSAGYWVAAAIVLVGCGTAIAWFLVAALDYVDGPGSTIDCTRSSCELDHPTEPLAVPGSTTLTLEQGDWVLYQLYSGKSPLRSTWPTASVVAADGRPIEVRPAPKREYGLEAYEVRRDLAEFTAPSTGSYTITSSAGDPDDTGRPSNVIRVGRPISDNDETPLYLSIALGFTSFAVGLVVGLVTLVRRRRD